MQPEVPFTELLARARRGDAKAAATLVGRYEPAIRRYVRLQLTDPRLRRVLDPADVCQSVLANFFVRASAGQFDLHHPEQLFKLLLAMARNRLLDHARRLRAGRRDRRRLEGGDGALRAVPDGAATPSRVLAGRELLDEVRRRLSDEERELMERRAEGLGWEEIALVRGGSPEALRKRLARALDRVGAELGLGEVDNVPA